MNHQLGKCRYSSYENAKITRSKRESRRTVRKALADPFFPLTFLIRNLQALAEEAHWKQLSCRLKKAQLERIFWERSLFFFEVRQALLNGRIREGENLPSNDAQNDLLTSYCDDCGGCCEIASGLPDFPANAEIPRRWRRIFGEGLGKGHRFCPFLFELRRSGKSFCSIHHWRPFPCRAFEEDECSFLKRDRPPFQPAKREGVSGTFKRLLQLINGG